MFDNLAAMIGYLVLDLIAGCFYAVIIAFFASAMTDIRLGGSDPNMEGLPSTFFGGVAGFIGGFILAWHEFSANASTGAALSHILLWWVIACVVLTVIVRLRRKGKNLADARKNDTDDTNGTRRKGQYPRHW